jgi:hypothetical protein
MPIWARRSRRQSRLYSASRTIRVLLIPQRASVQLRSMATTQPMKAASTCGRMTSGRWCMASHLIAHLIAFSGTPGPSHGAE